MSAGLGGNKAHQCWDLRKYLAPIPKDDLHTLIRHTYNINNQCITYNV
jgi:hypothetical protein